MTKYHVTTEKRTYNSINSREHLSLVMGNLGDTSEILAVSIWRDGHGWTKINQNLFMTINQTAFEWMTNRWNDGMTVCVTTHLQSIQITPKRREAVRINASGDLQIQAGKKWDTIIFSGVKVAAFKEN